MATRYLLQLENVLGSVFQSVTTYRDKEHCGGAMVEAVGREGDVTRLWIQQVADRPARRATRGQRQPKAISSRVPPTCHHQS
jgi:hypothetical protein